MRLSFAALFLAGTMISQALGAPVSKMDLDLARDVHVGRDLNGDNASPSLVERIVYNPRITSPGAGTVWQAGSKQNVTWDTSDIPAELKSSTSELKLGYEPANGKGGENLRWTLANKFPLSAGTVSFTVPASLATRDGYIVVLFGDSGNASPHFKIKSKAPSHKKHTH